MNAPHALPTPGPWRATEPNGPGMGWRVGPAWLGIDARSDQTAADARLIAAAPELLVALKLAALYVRAAGVRIPVGEEWATVQDAITKATKSEA